MVIVNGVVYESEFILFVNQFTPQSKRVFQCNGIALVRTFIADAFHGEVHLGKCKISREGNLRYFKCGKAECFLTGSAIKVYMRIVMFIFGAIVQAERIFGCACAVIDDVSEAVMLKGF